MNHLFLSSSFIDVEDQFTDYLSTISHTKSVTFIPTASLVEEVTFYVDEAKSLFNRLGFTVDILDLTTNTLSEIATKLQANNFIYVSGGNTFFLMDMLKKSGADTLILEQIAEGKIYIAESAGSVITAASIDYIAEMDAREKAPAADFYPGLNLVPFAIVPHYQAAYFKEAAETILSNYHEAYDLVPLKNNQVIIVEGEQVEIR